MTDVYARAAEAAFHAVNAPYHSVDPDTLREALTRAGLAIIDTKAAAGDMASIEQLEVKLWSAVLAYGAVAATPTNAAKDRLDTLEGAAQFARDKLLTAIRTAIAAGEARALERAAVVCERWAKGYEGNNNIHGEDGCLTCADAIRALNKAGAQS